MVSIVVSASISVIRIRSEINPESGSESKIGPYRSGYVKKNVLQFSGPFKKQFFKHELTELSNKHGSGLSIDPDYQLIRIKGCMSNKFILFHMVKTENSSVCVFNIVARWMEHFFPQNHIICFTTAREKTNSYIEHKKCLFN